MRSLTTVSCLSCALVMVAGVPSTFALSLPSVGSGDVRVRYDPDNIQTSGSDVTGWTNSGSLGATLNTTSTAGFRPTIDSGAANGFDAVSFDGGQYLDSGILGSTIAQPLTVFLVGRLDTISPVMYWYDDRTGSNRVAEFIQSGKPSLYTSNALASTTNAPFGTAFNIWGATYNTTSSSNTIDGTVIASGSLNAGGFDSFTLGSRLSHSSFLQGDIAELILFEGALTTEDFDLIGGYLAFKYDITGTAFSEFTPPPVPEPSTLSLLALGGVAMAVRNRRRTRRRK